MLSHPDTKLNELVVLEKEEVVLRARFDKGPQHTYAGNLWEKRNWEDCFWMAFTVMVFYSFCIGIISTLLVAVVIRASYKKYRKELVEFGGAQTQLGSIGSIILEAKNPGVIGILVLLPLMLTIFGGVGLYVQYLFQYLGSPTFTIILFMHMMISIVCLLLLVWFTMFSENGKARLLMNRVLRSYWRHRDEEILRLELRKLKSDGETQLRAFDLISKRGCKASLVAKEIANESTNTG